MNNFTIKFIEKHPRTLAKTISWRVLLTISHFVNGFIVTGSMASAASIAGLSAIINSVLYWAHERIWNWAQWNRSPKDGLMFLDGQPRTISKIITWRIVITGSNFVVPWILTGSLGQAAAFMSIAIFVNIAIFYFHERAWNRIIWGKIVKGSEIAV
jgi:uncharacterized membrane protein